MTSDQKKLLLSTLSVFALAAALATTSYFVKTPTRTTTHASALTDTIASQTTTLTSKLSFYTSTTNTTTKAQLSVDMQGLALSRKNNLLSLLPSDPKSFLSLATLGPTRNSFPKDTQRYIEMSVSKSGVYRMAHGDDFVNKTSVPLNLLDTGSSHYPLYIAGADIPTNNQELSVAGTLLSDKLVALSTGITKGAIHPSTPSSPVAGNRKALVMMVNVTDFPVAPLTRQDMVNKFSLIKNWFLGSSQNTLTLDASVGGWYTVAGHAADCNRGDWEDQASGMALSDPNVMGQGPWDFYIYVWPPFGDQCPDPPWAGVASGQKIEIFGNSINTTAVYIHEISHLIPDGVDKTLQHANRIDCGSLQIGPIPQYCNLVEYGDLYSMLDASSTSWDYNFFHKAELGWNNLTTVTADGIYTADKTTTFGARGLRVAVPYQSNGYWYYIGFRDRIQYDIGLPASFEDGVSIFYVQPYSSSINQPASYLINTTPTDGISDNPALSDGKDFYDWVHYLRITQLSHTSTTATVKIEGTRPVPTGQATPTPGAGTPNPAPQITACGCGASCGTGATCAYGTGQGCDPGYSCAPNPQGYVCYSSTLCPSGPQCPSDKNTQFYYDYSSSGTATTWYGGDFINSHPPTLPFYLDVNCFKELGAGFTEAGIKLTNKSGQVIASSDTFELRNVRITTSDVYTATCTQRDLSTCYDQDSFTILPPPPYSVEWGGIYGNSCSQIVGETVIWTPVPTATTYNVKITNVTTGAVYPANGVTGILSNGYVLYTFSTPFPVPGNYRASVAAINQYGTSAFANSTTNQNYPACTPTPSPSPTPIQWRAPDGSVCAYGTRSPSYYKYFSLPNCSGTANYHAQGGDCSTTGNGTCYKWYIPSYSAPAASYQTNSNPACTNLSSALNLSEMASTLTPCSWGPSPTPYSCASCLKVTCRAGLVCQCGQCVGSPAQ